MSSTYNQEDFQNSFTSFVTDQQSMRVPVSLHLANNNRKISFDDVNFNIFLLFTHTYSIAYIFLFFIPISQSSMLVR